MADDATLTETPDVLHTPDDAKLKAYFERIIRLEKEKKAIGDDIKDVYSEAKSDGYDVKMMRKAVAKAKKHDAEIKAEEEELPLYFEALKRSKESF